MIALSSRQVDQVLRAAAEKGTLAAMLAGLVVGSGIPKAALEVVEDPQLSQSFLSGLLVLAVLPADGRFVGHVDVARRLGMTSPTTHRYVRTLRAAGLVERDPDSPRVGLAL